MANGHNPDRPRTFSRDQIEQVRLIMQAELADRASLKKNGHTWWQWVWKVLTPERVLLALVLTGQWLFSIGGEIRDARRMLASASEQAVQASNIALSASSKAAIVSQDIADIRTDLTKATEAMKKQSAFNNDITDRVRRDVTRVEFASTVQQQILPRLDHIESELKVHDAQSPKKN